MVEQTMKSLNEFKESLKNNQPPVGVSQLLRALWWDAKGDWEKAHGIAQDISTSQAAWVHAYLHRKEGDQGNAGYWYARAGKSRFNGPLEQEWEKIVGELLD